MVTNVLLLHMSFKFYVPRSFDVTADNQVQLVRHLYNYSPATQALQFKVFYHFSSILTTKS